MTYLIFRHKVYFSKFRAKKARISVTHIRATVKVFLTHYFIAEVDSRVIKRDSSVTWYGCS